MVHVLADQFHLRELGDPVARNLEFRCRHDLADDAAGFGERHQADVARIGQAVPQQDFEKPELHLADFLAVHGRVAARLEEPQQPAFRLDQDLLVAQAGEGVRTDRIAQAR